MQSVHPRGLPMRRSEATLAVMRETVNVRASSRLDGNDREEGGITWQLTRW